jgi:hypothetical protein
MEAADEGHTYAISLRHKTNYGVLALYCQGWLLSPVRTIGRAVGKYNYGLFA